jgi:hypothetical protein
MLRREEVVDGPESCKRDYVMMIIMLKLQKRPETRVLAIFQADCEKPYKQRRDGSRLQEFARHASK